MTFRDRSTGPSVEARARLTVADRTRLHALIGQAFTAPPMPVEGRGVWYTAVLRDRLAPAAGVTVEHWADITADTGAQLIALCEAVIAGTVQVPA